MVDTSRSCRSAPNDVTPFIKSGNQGVAEELGEGLRNAMGAAMWGTTAVGQRGTPPVSARATHL